MIQGELEHRRVKNFYARTNKNMGFTTQITTQYDRGAAIRLMRARLDAIESADNRTEVLRDIDDDGEPTPPPQLTYSRYWMSHDVRSKNRHHILDFVNARPDDLALHLHDDGTGWDFVSRLYDHLSLRLRGIHSGGEDQTLTAVERSQVLIKDDRFYEHKKLLVFSTTYDLQRCSHTIRPISHPDIMVQAADFDEEPYWYGRVLLIFHIDCKLRTSAHWQTFDVVFVCWLAQNDPAPRRLPRVGWFNSIDSSEAIGAFGFTDPALIVRGAHIIPAFNAGRTNQILPGTSIARVGSTGDNKLYDYNWSYVNM